MGERSSVAKGNTLLRAGLLLSAAATGAAALAGCGKGDVQNAPTANIIPPSSASPLDVDPCRWNPNDHRPVTETGLMFVDSRCTAPATGLTYVYTEPQQVREKALRDANGEPIGIKSGTAVVAECVEKGQYVQNDKAVGSEWWVRVEVPDPDAPGMGQIKIADVPEVHAGFPLHDVQPNVQVGPGSLRVC